MDTTSWYKPSASIGEFHKSKARLRALIGGRGTGKTTGIVVESAGHCFWNAGAKVYILRKTQDANQDTTLETFEQVFPQLGTAYLDTGVSLFKKIDGGRVFRLPSKKATAEFNKWQQQNPGATKAQKLKWLDVFGDSLCSFVYFAGVPEERYRASRFRGYECSMLIFVEADQLTSEDLDLGTACLRWKGSDPESCDEKGFIKDTCVILDSNPPSPRHWIAKLEKDSAGDPNVRFWHLRTRDNSHNLPEGYTENLERQYRKNPAMYQRMVMGEYAEAFEGTPVLYQFSETHAKEDLPWPKNAYLIRGWDFGATNAVVWSAYWYDGHDEYWWDLYEYFAHQSDVDRQCKAVVEITNQVFPFWNDRTVCAGVKDYCDPAGNARTDKGSSVAVLRTYSIYPGFIRMGLQESIAVYNRLLEKKDRFGREIYQIDKKCCPRLYTASIGGYRYPVEGEPGFGGNEPLKGPAGGDYDHICFASGTKVWTEFGEKGIQDIKIGDKVWTRKGLRRISAAWQTSPSAETDEYKFSNGRSFRATKEHPVWSCQHGWKKICYFKPRELVLCASRLLNSTESAIEDTRIPSEPAYGHTSERVQGAAIYTGMSGNSLTGRFKRGCTSITEMETLQTTPLETLNLKRPLSTSPAILKEKHRQSKQSGISKKSGSKLPSGILHRKGENGISSTVKIAGRAGGAGKLFVPIVEKFLKLGHLILVFLSALTGVNRHSVENQERIMKSDNAFLVAKSTLGINIERPEVTAVHFVGRTPKENRNEPVYNLTVEGEHEFFAEGVLVSNCDGSRYAKFNCLRLIKAEVEAMNKQVGVIGGKPAENRKKRWY